MTNSSPKAVAAALLRYRVMAYVVGTVLVTLVLVALPLKYVAGVLDGPIAIAWTMHGWLFIVYIVTVLDLALRQRWHPGTVILTVLGGVVPFLSFVMERRVTQRTRAELAATSGGPGQS